MANNKVTIDVEARLVDNVSDKVKKIQTKLDNTEKKKIKIDIDVKSAKTKTKKIEDDLDKLGKKKVKPKIDADDKNAQTKTKRVQSLLNRLKNTKTKVLLDAMDKASSRIRSATGKAKDFAKTYSAKLLVNGGDALKTLGNVVGGAKEISGKVWRGTVKIIDAATSPIRKISSALFNLKTLFSAVVAGMAAQKIVMQPIGLADSYSSAKIGFSTLLGEAGGQKMMDDIDQFAKETPFKTSGVISNAQKMIAMGWNAKDVIKDLRTIGDAAAATGKGDEGLDRIILALSQIKSKGKLSTEELNQLAEAGISAKRYLAEGLGYGSSDEGLAKLSKDLERGAIGADKALKLITEGMKEYNGMMDKTANETVEGLKSQIEDTFEINVFRRWGQGLQDGAKKAFGSVVTLLDKADGSLKNFGDTLYQLGSKLSNIAATKLKDFIAGINKITDSDAFKNAGLNEKIEMLWSGVVADPISEWWESKGKKTLSKISGKIGEYLGEGITGFFKVLGGVGGEVTDGAVGVGASFAKGFLKGFDIGSIAKNIVKAIADAFQASPVAGLLMTGFIGKKLHLGSLISGGASVIGSLKGFIGTTGNRVMQGSGLLNFLAGLGYKLNGGAKTSTMSGGLAALKGAGAVGGAIVGGATLVSGGFDAYKGITANNKYDEAYYKTSATSKIAGVGVGAGIGAALGSVIPGLGTIVGGLIGAGLGGLGGWIFSDTFGKNAAKNTMSLKEASKVSSQAAEEFSKLKEAQLKLGNVELAKHFGKVTVSATEMSEVIGNIFNSKYTNSLEKISGYVSDAESALDEFNSTGASIEKQVWLATMKSGARITNAELKNLTKTTKLANEEVTALKDSVKSYNEAAETYLKNDRFAAEKTFQHYLGNGDDYNLVVKGLDTYYDKQEKELRDASEKLTRVMNEALSDGVITIDEEKSIANAMNAIDKIQLKLDEKNFTSTIKFTQNKYGGKGASLDSVKQMNEQVLSDANQLYSTEESNFQQQISKLKPGTDAYKTAYEGYINTILTKIWTPATNAITSNLDPILKKEFGVLGKDVSKMLKNYSIEELVKAGNDLTESQTAEAAAVYEMLFPYKDIYEGIKRQCENLGIEVPKEASDMLDRIDLLEILKDKSEYGDDFEKVLQDYLNQKKYDLKFDPDIEIDDGAKNLSAALAERLGTGVELKVDATGKIKIKTEKELDKSEKTIKDWYEQQFNNKFEIDADGNVKVRTKIEVDTSGARGKYSGPASRVLDIWAEKLGISKDQLLFTEVDGKVKVSVGEEVDYTSDRAEILEKIQQYLDTGDVEITQNGKIKIGDVSVALGSVGDINKKIEKQIPDANIEKNGNVTWNLNKTIGKILYPLIADIPGVELNKDGSVTWNLGKTIDSVDYPKPTDIENKTIHKTATVVWNFTKKFFGSSDDGHGFRGGIFTSTGPLKGFSQGGYVHGGAQRIVVAEEGDPEVVIPLSPRRRNRARKLWEQTGEIINSGFGKKGYSTGGFVGGNESFGGYSVDRNAVVTQSSGNNDQKITVNLGGIEIVVNTEGEQDVVSAVQEHQEEISEIIAKAIRQGISSQFQNMPARGV